ncbi:AMSH-like protease sst2 [Pseudocercospora fuligena]|uniref:AMSH-like protease sst2 n=1 Tax=Pseudocercospora fuligena TaxID=685502 RepID=A0A8H6RI26_9PEZI|nr:AMSH-like protease sst2 [Pseudocercospora fuligena]
MALSRHHAALTRPRSVEEIVKEAQDFEFNTNRSLQQWLRASKMLLTEAAICEQEGSLAMAYLYLYRHAELVLSRLPQHPDYRDSRFKEELSQARKTLQRNLVKLEQWKPRINQEHDRYMKAMERKMAERQRVQNEFDQAARDRASYTSSRRSSAASTSAEDHMQALNANENREFAVNLAQREIRRRDASRQSTTQAGISPATIAERRKGLVAQDDSYFDDREDPNDGVREAARHLHRQSYNSPREAPREARRSRQSTYSAYHYPRVPQKESRMEWSAQPIRPAHSQSRQSHPPKIPAKESLYDYTASELDNTPPPRPPKQDTYSNPASATPSPPPGESHQPPSKYTFKPTAYTESGSPLRTVLLPPDLRQKFLNLAHPNTSQNLETCGILAATTISGALFITHLILPDQTATSDTCDTTESGDNALFDYCSSNNLLVCGWIHTHPSQSCFLSSRDLHTSSGYQVMLPEAIAIVCAPRYNPDWGIFRLTDPPGLPHVLECRKPGTFHLHEEGNLYTDALTTGRQGHVVEGPGLGFEVVDLRK